MYVTTNYVGIRKGSVRYLFYLLTQDYIQDNVAIQQGVTSLLKGFARDLAGDGALVMPFDGTASENLTAATNRMDRKFIEGMHSLTPALLILGCDLQEFDPHINQHLIISLRDSMDEYGNIKVFEVQALLEALVTASRDSGLFEKIDSYLTDVKDSGRSSALWDSVQIRPNFFGVGMDLKAAIDVFRK